MLCYVKVRAVPKDRSIVDSCKLVNVLTDKMPRRIGSGSCHSLVALSKLGGLVLLVAAREGSERDLQPRILLRQELLQDHSKLAVSDSDATGAVAKRWKTCSLGFHLRQMLLQTLLDFMRQLLSHLNPSMQVFPLQQHLSQMKSETASFPPLCNSSCRI